MNDIVRSFSDQLFGFGSFVLDRAGKQLLKDGQTVRIGNRAFDLLIKLVECAGEVVSRDELVAFVWPSTMVEETSLRVHVSALRKALDDGQGGARYIANVPGRGYSFVMPVTPMVRTSGAAALAFPPRAPAAPCKLPARPMRTIGRAGVIAQIGGQLARHRLISIVGPGGMGKTTVALAVAEHEASVYADGVRFVDLAALSDPALVVLAVAVEVGIPEARCASLSALAASLCEQRMLIVLDNCEHVIHAAATLVEAVLMAAPGVQFIATSREPIDANGEWVHRLAALAAPDLERSLSVAQVLEYPAVQLFVERAMANTDGFALSDANLSMVVHLCRRLDGIPLAIELAAARVDTLGVQGLVARLDDMFRLLTRGRRTALPRHRTLQALFDWSYALLSENERRVLCRLAMFRTRFTFEAAAAVAAGEEGAGADVIDCVMSLAAKSLVATETSGATVCHRLLYTARTYAADRLLDSGERHQVAGRHAAYFLGLFTHASAELDTLSVLDWHARHGYLMDDLRAALDWSLSPDGDAVVGAELVIATCQPVYGVGRLDSHRQRVELALESIARLTPPQPELELRTRIAWCNLSGQTRVAAATHARIVDSTVALAERIGSERQVVAAMHGACSGYFGQGNYPAALSLATRLRQCVGDDDPAAVLLSDRLAALCLHFLGNHRQARQLALKVLAHPEVRMSRECVSGVPKAVSMRIVLARMLWIEGQVDQAMQVGLESVALSQGCVPFVSCQALGVAAIPLALWRGDLDRARTLIAQLLALASGDALEYWESWGNGFAHIAAGRGASPTAGAPAWQWPNYGKEMDMFATLDASLLADEALARSEQGLVGWCAPEVFRAHGERLLHDGAPDAGALAEAMFLRAIAAAHEQQALSWELRAATSLARLWQGAARRDEAHALLDAVYGRFAEGFDTADLCAARALLDALTPGGSDA